MKSLKIIALILFLSIYGLYGFSQEKQKLITLAENEIFQMSESQIFAGTGVDFCIITSIGSGNSKKFFVHTKAGKKGPFSANDVELCPPESEDIQIIYERNDQINYDEYVQYLEDGYYITFNGKKYGPYTIVMSCIVTPDKKKFYAAVTEETNSYFISSDGKKTPIQGIITMMHVSPDGSNAIAGGVGNMNLQDLQNIDPTKIDVNELNKAMIYSSNGQKFGPFPGEGTQIWYPVFSQSWLMQIDSDIYVDGVKWKNFPDGISQYNLYFKDKNHYAYISGDKLTFADGKSFAYPLRIQVDLTGSSPALRWIVIEGKDVYVYKKAL